MILGAIKETDEPVAIKILFSDTPNNRTDADRFRQEVETMGRMQHPNIVRLLDHGMAGTYNYLVMEWIDGPSLRQVITNTNQANRPLGFNDALLAAASGKGAGGDSLKRHGSPRHQTV